jgi:D-alanine--poly(phosphoribitol) ligase subunit 1
MFFFLEKLLANFSIYSDNNAFHIEGESFTYARLGSRVSAIQKKIAEFKDEDYFGVITRNSVDTYAAIFAIWLSGKTSVPLSVNTPKSRISNIVDQVGIKVVFDAFINPMLIENTYSINTLLLSSEIKPFIHSEKRQSDLYLLFTSGSSGFPKGVRISVNNLNSYLDAISGLGYQLDCNDRCLQVYDLTFDGSIQSYLFPLLYGASVYTIPQDEIKFLSIIKAVNNYQITFLKMTPSVLHYLMRYLDRIEFPSVRWSIFGGEALLVSLIEKWQNCVPNAEIQNVYGPTETTVNCSMYQWRRDGLNKERNGILSLGKIYQGSVGLVFNENGFVVQNGVEGELCISGPQVTSGYWGSELLNSNAFFTFKVDGVALRFYRTGDRVIKDDDGDLFFIGRNDSQIQINGYRVEVGEIENHAGYFTNARCIALVHRDVMNVQYLYLFVESDQFTNEEIITELKSKIPDYMLPHKVIFVDHLALLSSSKVDRQKLLELI